MRVWAGKSADRVIGRRRRAGSAARGLAVLAVALGALGAPGRAHAIPAFAQQTGQPCAACHVGAFGPQLKQFGRDFKLNGYVSNDGQKHGVPIAATVQTSFTHTNADQQPAAAPHFAANNNPAVDQVSLYYGGAVTKWLGAFAQVTYDGIADQLAIDNTDVRHAQDGELFGQDMVWGIDANNSPTMSDLWNSTPVWGFPYNGSALAPGPAAATLIDGGLGQRVAGGGAYVSWNDLVYLETDLYSGLGYDVLNATGIVPVAGTDKTVGVIPYWRAALEQDFGRHYVEVGTYGLAASVLPGGVDIPGLSNRLTDVAVDANYQFTLNPKSVVSDMVSAHATMIHEDDSLAASHAIGGANPQDHLTTVRADVSYSLHDTWIPSVQYFSTGGSPDAAYWGTPSGKPDSRGVITELAYVPWGKPDSPIQFGNVRLAVQYVSYLNFDGAVRGASANNALYVSVWLATHF